MIANTVQPPYYAVIFTSIRTSVNDGYTEMAIKMEELAQQQSGYLGHEGARENDLGITVSYWQSIEAIKNWKQVSEHIIAQQLGKEKWYSHYKTRICLVEREYEFEI